MDKVVLDAATRAKLNGLNKLMEVVDETGTPLGFFHPMPKGSTVSPEGGWGPFTAEEIAEAMKDKSPGRPLADIIADLRRNYP
jgi:hypothetical protein